MKSLAVADRYGWARYVAHQAYYSLVGRDYRMGIDAAGARPKGRHGRLEPAGLGPADRQDSPRPAVARPSAAGTIRQANDIGPPAPDEYVYRVVDVLDEVAPRRARPCRRSPSIGCSAGRAWRRSSSAPADEEQLRQNLGAVGWTLTPEQVARLDAVSQTTLTYPYWHQRRLRRTKPAAGLRIGRSRFVMTAQDPRRGVLLAGRNRSVRNRIYGRRIGGFGFALLEQQDLQLHVSNALLQHIGAGHRRLQSLFGNPFAYSRPFRTAGSHFPGELMEFVGLRHETPLGFSSNSEPVDPFA